MEIGPSLAYKGRDTPFSFLGKQIVSVISTPMGLLPPVFSGFAEFNPLSQTGDARQNTRTVEFPFPGLPAVESQLKEIAMIRWFRTLPVLAALLPLLALPLTAQQNTSVTGGLNGTVVDSTSAVVAGATVTLTGPQGTRVVMTDTMGHYSFSGLDPGILRCHSGKDRLQDGSVQRTTKSWSMFPRS